MGRSGGFHHAYNPQPQPLIQPPLHAISKMFDSLKSKIGGNKKNEEEQQFSIQPHPAVRAHRRDLPSAFMCSLPVQKTNDPADLQRDQPGGGLNSQNEPASAFHARGPYQPPAHITNNLEQPAVSDYLGSHCLITERLADAGLQSREELQARQAELNK